MKKAFSLAEILLTLMIVAVVALMSTNVVKSKKKKVEEVPSQGVYACTVLGGESYVFENPVKDTIITNIQVSKTGWTKKKCLDGFEPPKEGVVEVTVIGGGGAGGNAGVTKSETLSVNYNDDAMYEIKHSGFYDIELRGSQGTSSSMWLKTVPFTFLQDALYGNAVAISGRIQLNKGDTVRFKFTSNGEAFLPTSPCKKADVVFIPGRNGDNLKVYRNGKEIGGVNGSSAGNYTCINQNLNTQERYSRNVYGDPDAWLNQASNSNTERIVRPFHEFSLKWYSDLSGNQSDSVTETLPGKGGGAGAITSTIYPIFSKKMPKVVIGAGGVNGGDGGYTSFASLVADGGKGNSIDEPVGNNSKNGSNGSSFTSLKNHSWAGGGAGTTSSVNGKNATGYGAGGGGAAISSYSSGYGGSGAPGLLILRW